MTTTRSLRPRRAPPAAREHPPATARPERPRAGTGHDPSWGETAPHGRPPGPRPEYPTSGALAPPAHDRVVGGPNQSRWGLPAPGHPRTRRLRAAYERVRCYKGSHPPILTTVDWHGSPVGSSASRPTDRTNYA